MRARSGQVLPLVAVGLVALLSFLATVAELGRVFYAKASLQDFCDAAALAGAFDLPDTDEAKSSAILYFAKSAGLDPSKINQTGSDGNSTTYEVGDYTVRVTSPYRDERTEREGVPPERAIEVFASRKVPILFFSLLGVRETTVNARAVAARGGKFTVFAEEGGFTFSGSANVIEGNVHSNGDALISGTENEVTGVVYYAGKFVLAGASNTATGEATEPRPFPSLPHSLDWYKERAVEEGTLFTGDVEIQGGEGVNGIVYIEGGDIYVTGSYIEGSLTLIAPDGEVVFKGSHYLNLGPYVDGLLAYGGARVYLSGGDNRLRGLLYSPGTVEFEQEGIDFKGGIAGGSVVISGHDGRFAPSVGAIGVGERCVLLE